MKKASLVLCCVLVIMLLFSCLFFWLTPVRCISMVTETCNDGSVVTVDVDCDRFGNALKYRKEWDNSFEEVSFTFDHRGNLLTKTRLESVLNQSRTTTYQYDDHGNLISQNNDPNNYNEYTYDENGVMIKKRYFSSGKLIRTCIYDGNGNLIEDSLPSSFHVLYTYNEQNHLTASYQVLNGKKVLVSAHTYGEDGKMLQSVYYDILDGGQQLSSTTTRTYDNRGHLIKEHQQHATYYRETTWTYDDAGRKLTEDHSSDYYESYHREWAYDKNGNLTRFLNNGFEETWSYDRHNNLIGYAYSNNGFTSSVEITYTTVYLFESAASKVRTLQSKILKQFLFLEYFRVPEFT